MLKTVNLLLALMLPSSALAALVVLHHSARSMPAAIALQDVPPMPAPDQDPGAWVQFVIWAFRTKAWAPLIGAILMGLMWGLRKLFEEEHWIKTDRGGATLVLLLGVLGSLSALLLTPKVQITAASVITCVMTAVVSAGGYTLIKKIIKPSDKPGPAKLS
jgi:hypothetical protein